MLLIFTKCARRCFETSLLVSLALPLGTLVNGQALDSDPAEVAKQTLEQLEQAVPIEPIQLDTFKDQTEKLIELELENESLKAKIDELQKDIDSIRKQNSLQPPRELNRAVRLLSERKLEIEQLQKEIKNLRGGSFTPVPVAEPVNQEELEYLKSMAKELESSLEQLEKENNQLRKVNSIIEEENKQLHRKSWNKPTYKTNTPAPIAESDPETPTVSSSPSVGVTIFDESITPRKPTRKENSKAQASISQVPSSNKSSSHFDNLLSETDPEPIENVEEFESTTPSQAPISPATDFSILDNVPTQVEPRTDAIPSQDEPKPTDFSILDDPKKTEKLPLDPPPAPETSEIKPTPEVPTDFTRLNNEPETVPAPETNAPISAPIEPIIASTFQNWIPETNYKSLLPKPVQAPEPPRQLDLLSNRSNLLGSGLEHYDIPGLTVSNPQNPVEEDSSASTTTPLDNEVDLQIPLKEQPQVEPSGIKAPLPEVEINSDQVKPEETLPPPTTIATQPPVTKTTPQPTSEPKLPKEGLLEIEASVEYQQGQPKPAYHTEIFITRQGLNEILGNDPELRESMDQHMTGKNISTYAELWARSQKFGYAYPGLAAKIRNTLKKASTHRTRTNAVGKAQLNLEGKEELVGERYIIGVTSLGTIGVVWSKQFYMQEFAIEDKTLTLESKEAIWLQ